MDGRDGIPGMPGTKVAFVTLANRAQHFHYYMTGRFTQLVLAFFLRLFIKCHLRNTFRLVCLLGFRNSVELPCRWKQLKEIGLFDLFYVLSPSALSCTTTCPCPERDHIIKVRIRSPVGRILLHRSPVSFLYLKDLEQFTRVQWCNKNFFSQGEPGKPGPPGDAGLQGLPVSIWVFKCLLI